VALSHEKINHDVFLHFCAFQKQFENIFNNNKKTFKEIEEGGEFVGVLCDNVGIL